MVEKIKTAGKVLLALVGTVGFAVLAKQNSDIKSEIHNLSRCNSDNDFILYEDVYEVIYEAVNECEYISECE